MKMIENILNALNNLNPVSPVNIFGQNVDLLSDQFRLMIKYSPLSDEQKKQYNAMIDIMVANWYFIESVMDQNESLINFRKKIFINVIRETMKKNLDIVSIAKLMQLGIDKEIEILKKDDKYLGKIITDLREKFLEALFNKDKDAWANFAQNYREKQYWTKRGPEKLKEIVRKEYGLKNGTKEVHRTSCLRLLEVIPVFAEGEKPEDYYYVKQPFVIEPPTVLDPDVVCFLPNYGMSLVHHLAKHNPVYVLTLNDFDSREVRGMTKEEYIEQTAEILKFVYEKEKIKPIFGGYCQGGTLALLSTLTEQVRPYVKAVITMAAATGKKDEDSEISALFYESLNLAREVVKNGYMVAPEFLSIALKEDPWSPFRDLLNKMIRAEKYHERIRQLIEDRFYNFSKAVRVFAYEVIKEIVIEIWLDSMRSLPIATTEMTLPVFRDGISADGSYSLELFGKRINVKDFERYGIPVYIFTGEFDKVVPPDSATEITNHVNNSHPTIVKGGHISLATNFKNGGELQKPIVEAIREIFNMN